jgi:hypothetical protein
MNNNTLIEQRILQKIRNLSLDKILELENFIDLLYQQENDTDYHLTLAASKLSETVFEKIWNNPEDAEYDNL